MLSRRFMGKRDSEERPEKRSGVAYMGVVLVHRGKCPRTRLGEPVGEEERDSRGGPAACRVLDAEATSGDITPMPKAVVCP